MHTVHSSAVTDALRSIPDSCNARSNANPLLDIGLAFDRALQLSFSATTRGGFSERKIFPRVHSFHMVYI